MKMDFDNYIIFGLIVLSIYAFIIEDMFLFLYGMIGSIIIINWLILNIISDKFKK